MMRGSRRAPASCPDRPDRPDRQAGSSHTAAVLIAIAFLIVPDGSLHAQTTGSIVGVVRDDAGVPLAEASIRLSGFELTAISDSTGRFVIASIPAGERSLRVERIGFRPLDLTGIVVSLGRPTSIEIALEPLPVAVPGVEVEALRVRLVEPDVSATREVLMGREIRALPVDRSADAIELAPGVSGGHFRGGRVGQEVHVVDGLEVKNQLEASAHGPGLELPPGALEEVEIVTGGIGAMYGSALSGVVSWVTRRGSTERWEGRTALLTDQWAPESLFRGFSGLSVSAGGPLRFLAPRATFYVDLLGQGLADSDPRARGLGCIEQADATPDVAALIASVEARTPALSCPYSGPTLPHQQGDKRIAFARLDVPAGATAALTFSFLDNRLQRLLYTPSFKYSNGAQLGQRSGGSMVSAGVDIGGRTGDRARHISLRVGHVRLDRYLGVIDPASLAGRGTVAGFGLSGYEFLGEDAVHAPIERQLAEAAAVPGYGAPGGIDSPFGPAGADLFFTSGTPDVANWTRSHALSADLVAEFIDVGGGLLRAGASGRYYQVESYERTLAHLAGSLPAYARFHPASVAAFVEGRLAGDEELTLNLGLRFEAFRSGVRFQQDRSDFQSPIIDPDWQMALMPRLGIALPLPGTDRRTAVRLSYGHVAQAPDFRFFLDTAIGDSIRRAVRRQGNPAIAFERGRTFEAALSHLAGPHVGLTLTGFRKELQDLASGNVQIGPGGLPQYSVNDFGTVTGVELSVRGRWDRLSTRIGWVVQKATGASSGSDVDTTVTVGSDVTERPLAFDQRHAIDVAILYGEAAGDRASRWSAALTARAASGYPLDRGAAAGDTVLSTDAYLPWTHTVDLRLAWSPGRLPGCGGCSWRLVADARNLLGRENVIALQAESGRLAPSAGTISAVASALPQPIGPIPAESPLYRATVDANRDGLISLEEFDAARLAAVLDRFDPSLMLGSARSVRLGFEVSF